MKKKHLLKACAGLLALQMILASGVCDVPAYAKTNDKQPINGIDLNDLKVHALTGQEKYNKEKKNYVSQDDLLTAGDSVSDSGIAEAFREKDFTEMYKTGLFKLTGAAGVTAAYDKAAYGLLVSGTKADIEGTRFTLEKQMDFSEGTIERIQIDALAKKNSKLTLNFFLDDEVESFASVNLAKQKRSGKWYTKNMAYNVYDKKITGKHKISFTVTQNAESTDVGFVLRTITFVKSTVPTIYFDIDETEGTIEAMNNDIDHKTECYGKMTIQIPDGYQCEYADKDGNKNNLVTTTYDLDYIRGRGNSTWGNPKRPYKVKLNKKADLFNMGKNKHWVLLADYFDPSHIRNKNTYNIGEKMGLAYTPECVYVDVVMNGEYYGSYLLSEQVRLDENRVDLDNLEKINDFRTIGSADKSTITGGYLLSMFPYHETIDKRINTEKANEYTIESPSFEEYESEEAYKPAYDYISKYMQDTEDAIYGKNFKNLAGKSYEDYMDVDSAVKYWWMQEFSMNGDAFGSGSTYLYKKKDGKLFWGPLWDFDYVAWGNNQYKDVDGYSAEGWSQMYSTWFQRLMADKNFSKKAREYWKTFKPMMVNAAKSGGTIDQYAKMINYSMYYNNLVYGNNYNDYYLQFTFKQNVEQLKGWINERIQWVDNNIESLVVEEYTITFMDGNKQVAKDVYISGECVKFPKIADKKDYVFAGWYAIDDMGDEKYEYEVNSLYAYYDMTVYAKWIKKSEYKAPKKLVLGYDTLVKNFYQEWSEREFIIPYNFIGGYGNPADIEWTSSNPSVVQVLDDGNFKIKDFGDTTITATFKKGDTKLSAKCKVNIKDGRNSEYTEFSYFELGDTSTDIKVGDYFIINPKVMPEDAVDYWFEYSALSDEVKFTVVGDKCIVEGAEVGTATIKIKVRDYEQYYKINVHNKYNDPISIKPGCEVTRNNVRYKVMSMTTKGGTVKVVGLAKKGITSVKIPSNITIEGMKYKVTSIAANAFSKKVKVTLPKELLPKPKPQKPAITNTKPPKTNIISVSAGKKAFTVKWTKKNKNVTGYEIQYSLKSDFKSKKKTVKVKSAKVASKTISKLKGKQKYYVRIRTYKTVKGKNYYSAWSAKKVVTTKK